jgi:alcohol sulfotransferase
MPVSTENVQSPGLKSDKGSWVNVQRSIGDIMVEILEHFAKSYLPLAVVRSAKQVLVYPRYVSRARACRNGFRQFGSRYPQKVLFIAGLPKSGTTWLEKMISSHPGFHDLLIPEVAAHDFTSGGSHDYELPPNMFSRFKGMLVLTKMHVPGSVHNVELLRSAGVRYVVLYRDLRDVAVSHFYYVRQTPWHPEYPVYAKLSLHEGLEEFAKRTLLAYANWIRSWHENRDPHMSLVLRYEQMLADPTAAMTNVAKHFELDSSPGTIRNIVERHSFQRLSGGRRQGQQNTNSFFRKGIAGDWKNYFTPELKETYKKSIGKFFIEFGYERDLSW